MIRRLAIVLWVFAAGCGPSVVVNPDVYHVGRHGWVDDRSSTSGDTIYFQLFKTSEPSEARPSLPKIMADCQSCNLVREPERVIFDESGVGRVVIPETSELISARLHLKGSGIDTTFIQKQRSPEEAMHHFALRARAHAGLVGRVLVDQLSLLYRDSTQDSVVAYAQTGDELNIYAERPAFFVVHHPRYAEPLYLLKSDAVRLY